MLKNGKSGRRIMLTEEQCREALHSAKEKTTEIEDYGSIPKSTFSYIANELSLFEQLIKEHFKLVKEYKSCREELEGLYSLLYKGKGE